MMGLGSERMWARKKKTSLAVIVLAALLYAPTTFGFSITFFDVTRQGSEFRITMAADLSLTENVIEALQSNIDIAIRVQVKIYRIRENFWDDLVADTKIDYTLSNSNLFRGYSVRSSDRNLDRVYDSLSAALDAVGSERTYKIVVPEKQSDESDDRYRGKCRIFLDRSKLPPLVSTTVYFNNSWKRNSGWTEFEL